MFSIIIPIYNVSKYLPDCLDSIVNQTYKGNLEVFLVNDGSTDDSGEIAQQYEKKYPHIFKYLVKENGGLSDARNFAIPYVHNDYVFFIDSDDYIQPNTLETIANVINNYSPDLIIFDYIKQWEDKGILDKILEGNSRLITNKEYLLANPAAWNKIIKTTILKENKILYPKGLWYEDRATTGQYINFCKKIYYVSEGFYTYRQRDNSIMKQNSYNPKMLDICQAMKMFDRQVDDHEYKSEKEYLFISNLLFQNSLRLLPLKKNKEMKECYDILEKKYPNWKQNLYYQKQSKGYKILCLLISKRLYFISRILIKYKMKGA